MRRFALLFVVLAVAMTVAAPAAARGGAVNNRNHPAFWEAKYADLNLDCYKVEDGFGHAVKVRSDGYYDLVLVKGGPGYPRKFWDVEPGDWLKAPWNYKNQKKYAISYIIYCTSDASG